MMTTYLVADSPELGDLTVASERDMRAALRSCCDDWFPKLSHDERAEKLDECLALCVPLDDWPSDDLGRLLTDSGTPTRAQRIIRARLRAEAGP